MVGLIFSFCFFPCYMAQQEKVSSLANEWLKEYKNNVFSCTSNVRNIKYIFNFKCPIKIAFISRLFNADQGKDQKKHSRIWKKLTSCRSFSLLLSPQIPLFKLKLKLKSFCKWRRNTLLWSLIKKYNWRLFPFNVLQSE